MDLPKNELTAEIKKIIRKNLELFPGSKVAASAFVWKLMHQKMETDRKFNVKKGENKVFGVMKAKNTLVKQIKSATIKKSTKR